MTDQQSHEDAYEKQRLAQLDFINERLKQQGHAAYTFKNVDNAIKEYYLVTGNPKISVQFPKAKKGEYSIKIIKQEFTYVYLQTLKAELFTKFAEDASALAQSLPQRFQDKPNDLVANYHHPTKEQARATYTRRFSKPEGTKE
ncbi:hypothetical protein ACOMHN_004891 [Nucella lapillus]